MAAFRHRVVWRLDSLNYIMSTILSGLTQHACALKAVKKRSFSLTGVCKKLKALAIWNSATVATLMLYAKLPLYEEEVKRKWIDEFVERQGEVRGLIRGAADGLRERRSEGYRRVVGSLGGWVKRLRRHEEMFSARM